MKSRARQFLFLKEAIQFAKHNFDVSFAGLEVLLHGGTSATQMLDTGLVD